MVKLIEKRLCLLRYSKTDFDIFLKRETFLRSCMVVGLSVGMSASHDFQEEGGKFHFHAPALVEFHHRFFFKLNHREM